MYRYAVLAARQHCKCGVPTTCQQAVELDSCSIRYCNRRNNTLHYCIGYYTHSFIHAAV